MSAAPGAPSARPTPSAESVNPPTPLTGTVMDERVAVHPALRAARWVVKGTSKILGDAEVIDSEVQGLVSVKGRFVAARCAVRGTVEVDGEVRVAEQLKLEGQGRFGGPLFVGSGELVGTTEVASSVTTTHGLSVTGKLGTKGGIQSPTIAFRGRVESGGDWTAQSVDARLEGDSRVREIRAPRIQIRREGIRRPGRLNAGRIEGQTVYLEGVEAEYLKAEEIELGPDCHIAQVDGSIVRRHKSAYVGFEVRSNPPPWLSR